MNIFPDLPVVGKARTQHVLIATIAIDFTTPSLLSHLVVSATTLSYNRLQREMGVLTFQYCPQIQQYWVWIALIKFFVSSTSSVPHLTRKNPFVRRGLSGFLLYLPIYLVHSSSPRAHAKCRTRDSVPHAVRDHSQTCKITQTGVRKARDGRQSL